jgi:GNAT superfamily N-acetyltransferase
MSVREARPDDVAGIARVHVDSWRTTYPGIMPDAYLASLDYDERERFWERALGDPEVAASRRVVFVAEDEIDDGRIVGFASGGPAGSVGSAAGYAGELYMIYLLASHQGKGLGRRLFQRVVERLVSNGWRSLFVWVARDNPARRFYEALGGIQVTERRAKVFGQAVDEVGYGWTDVGPLFTARGE